MSQYRNNNSHLFGSVLVLAACHQLKDYCLVNILENTVKLILETDIKIDPYNKEVARRLLKYS